MAFFRSKFFGGNYWAANYWGAAAGGRGRSWLIRYNEKPAAKTDEKPNEEDDELAAILLAIARSRR